MTDRQVISVLRRLKTPYNEEPIEQAVDALKAIPIMEKINSDLLEGQREQARIIAQLKSRIRELEGA